MHPGLHAGIRAAADAARRARLLVSDIPVVGSALRPNVNKMPGAAVSGGISTSWGYLKSIVAATISLVIDDLDLTPLILDRIDLNRLLDHIDIRALLERVEVVPVVARVDIDEVVARLDLDSVVSRLDIDLVVERLDLGAVVDRIDVDALVARLDMDSIVRQIDLVGLVGALLSQTNLSTLIPGLPRATAPDQPDGDGEPARKGASRRRSARGQGS